MKIFLDQYWNFTWNLRVLIVRKWRTCKNIYNLVTNWSEHFSPLKYNENFHTSVGVGVGCIFKFNSRTNDCECKRCLGNITLCDQGDDFDDLWGLLCCSEKTLDLNQEPGFCFCWKICDQEQVIWLIWEARAHKLLNSVWCFDFWLLQIRLPRNFNIQKSLIIRVGANPLQ